MPCGHPECVGECPACKADMTLQEHGLTGHQQEHRPAVRAVMNAGRGKPTAADKDLEAAKYAGLIEFTHYSIALKGQATGWWQLTSLGSDLMTDY